MKPDLQTPTHHYRLGFIGAGKLAGSVIRGLLRMRFCPAEEIIAGEPNDELRAAVQAETGVAVNSDNLGLARTAETILIGVKPGVVLAVIREIAPVTGDKLVISLAAGVRLRNMEAISGARFIRAMTNTPTAIGRGATAIARGTRTIPDDVSRARTIFDAIGVTVEVNEDQIDAVTALAGSGPAFVYTVIEALADGGIKTGLPSDVAAVLATHTVLGAAQLAAETGMSPEELRRMVVTPGGTTAAGLAAMKEMKGSEAISAAVEAATNRGREMAKEFSS